MKSISMRTRVLVIDDDDLVRSALRASLECRGFMVRVAKDGLSALREVERECFDVVFVDIFMPSMDGFEIIRKLRQTCADMPIVAMSGMSGHQVAFGAAKAPDYLAMAIALGADHALPKPFSLDDLWRVISECFDAPVRDVGAGAASQVHPGRACAGGR